MLRKGIRILILSFFCVIRCKACEHGFSEIDQVKYGTDTLHTYQHKTSGLTAVWIENDDNRKGFVLGVKTPTTDNTGVNHIIEHTVFTGSKEYPYSSLFFDASAAYPNLFMNALTSGDMTIYPFATPYTACYNELLNIYLSSIFHPNMLKESCGFYEESFNYNPDTKAFGGVVYNEMKGACTSIDRAIYRSIRRAAYDGTHYAYDSGGSPNEIPKLTYAQFVSTYRKYYYPGNMKIILYGSLPIDKVLATINAYLGDYHHIQPEINLTASLQKTGGYYTYDVISEKENPCLIKSFAISEKLSSKELLALDLWMDAYLLNPSSLFQKQLRMAGFTNVKITKDDDVPYPLYSIVVKDIKNSDINTVNQQLDQIISGIRKNFRRDKAIERDTIKQSQLNLLSENSAVTRGIEIGYSILDSWAHDREPFQYYIKKNCLEKMKLLDESSKRFFDTSHTYTVALMPSKQRIINPLSLSQLTDNRWKRIIKEMTMWQSQTSKLKSVLPQQLIIQPEHTAKIATYKNYTSIRTNVSKGLARSQLYYNTSHIKQSELPYLFLYAYFLEEGAKELTPFEGIFNAKCTAVNTGDRYQPMLRLSILTTQEVTDHGGIFEKIRTYLRSKDADWYQNKLMRYVSNFKETWRGNILSALSTLDMGCEKDAKRYLYEQGYPLYIFSDTLCKSKEKNWIQKIKDIDSLAYQNRGLFIATAVPTKYTNPYEASWKKVINHQIGTVYQQADYIFSRQPQKSLLISDTQVDYMYLHYAKPDGRLDGADYVTAAYLTEHYLNPRIRTQLGAYGTGCQLSSLNSISLFTYRDPNCKVSLDVFKGIPDYLTHHINDNLLEKTKIEALSRVHSQFKLSQNEMEQADAMERNILMGINEAYIQSLQSQIIKTTKEELQEKAELFKHVLKEGALGIATSRQAELIGDYKLYQFK